MRRFSRQEFVEKSKAHHGDRYDYSLVDYTMANRTAKIICPQHGPFNQQPWFHMNGRGCPMCAAVERGGWSGEEDAYLKDRYQQDGARSCGDYLDRPRRTVIARARKLGLSLPQKRLAGYRDISGSYWAAVQNGASSRGLTLTITLEDIWNQYEKQDRKCALTGWSVEFRLKGKMTASLDRIDSSQGYLPDNIQIVHKMVNRAKVNYDELDFYALCKAVHEHRIKDFEHVETEWMWDRWHDTDMPVNRRVLGRPEARLDYSVEAIFGS